MAYGCECTLDGIGGSDVFPMLRWEVIERQQHVTILDQLGDSLFVFHAVGFNEKIKGGVGLGLGFRLPDVVQMALGFDLHGFRHRVQDIAGFMKPTPLLCGLCEHFT